MIDLDFAIERLCDWGIEARYPIPDDFDGELTVDELPKDYIRVGTRFYTMVIHEDTVAFDICLHQKDSLLDLQSFIGELECILAELNTALCQILDGREIFEGRLKWAEG